jgi:hypothetical protein
MEEKKIQLVSDAILELHSKHDLEIDELGAAFARAMNSIGYADGALEVDAEHTGKKKNVAKWDGNIKTI